MKVTVEKRRTRTILLDTVDKVKEFVQRTSKFMYDVQVVSGRYIVDGRSILGIMSLDLSKPVVLNVDERDSEAADVLLKKFYVR